MPLYPSTNFLIQRYYQNEVRLYGFYLRNYLSKKKDRVFVINLDQYQSIGTHWIASHVSSNNVTCFEKFRVECISKEMRKIINHKNMTTKKYKIQAYDQVISGYFFYWIY